LFDLSLSIALSKVELKNNFKDLVSFIGLTPQELKYNTNILIELTNVERGMSRIHIYPRALDYAVFSESDSEEEWKICLKFVETQKSPGTNTIK
jgi:hypothetical protein